MMFAPVFLSVALDAEAITRAEREATDAGAFTSVELQRARLGLALDLPSTFARTGADLRVEAIRSAARDSVLGVAGDSLIVRMAVAQAVFAERLGPVSLTARAGLVEEGHRAAVAAAWDLRMVDDPLGERADFGETADLGGALSAAAFDGRLSFEAAVTNGEGPAEVEQDDRKNVALTLAGSPVEWAGHSLRLSVQGQRGTRGAGGTRHDAVALLAAVVGPRLGVGAEYTRVAGHLDRGDRDADALGLYARGLLWSPWLGVYLRFDRLDTDYAATGSVQKRLGAGLYSNLVDDPSAGRLRLALGGQQDTGGGGAVPRPLPDTTRVFLSVAFDFRELRDARAAADPARGE